MIDWLIEQGLLWASEGTTANMHEIKYYYRVQNHVSNSDLTKDDNQT